MADRKPSADTPTPPPLTARLKHHLFSRGTPPGFRDWAIADIATNAWILREVAIRSFILLGGPLFVAIVNRSWGGFLIVAALVASLAGFMWLRRDSMRREARERIDRRSLNPFGL